MTGTVQQLIENLQGYPGNLVIRLKDVEEDQEFSIISFNPGANTLTLVISEEKEEKDGETAE